MNTLSHLTSQYASWMENQALPLWQQCGFQAQGGAYEKLDQNGNPDTFCPTRVRVHFRQITVFANAARLGLIQEGAPYCRQLERFIHRYAVAPLSPSQTFISSVQQLPTHFESHDDNILHHHLYSHVLDMNHTIIDDTIDCYDHAFALLAYATLFQQLGQAKDLAKAECIANALDNVLKHPEGGWKDSNKNDKRLRQNPHMHLFESFLLLYELTRNQRWKHYCDHIYALFQQHFFEDKRGFVLEFFHPDWKPLTHNEGQHVEPGHLFEWVWLLSRYTQLTGIPTRDYTQRLYASALQFGQDTFSGLFFDGISFEGKVIDAKKRNWALTEYIKASLCRAKEDNKTYEAHAVKGLQLLFEYYVKSDPPGTYVDQLNAHNRGHNKTSPTSTLYHFMSALDELLSYQKYRSSRNNNSAIAR